MNYCCIFRTPIRTAAFLLLGVTRVMFSTSLPTVVVRNSQNQKIAKARIRLSGGQGRIDLKSVQLQPGSYRVLLSRGRKCFVDTTAPETQATVAETAVFAVPLESVGGSPPVLLLDRPRVDRMIACKELFLLIEAQSSHAPVGCGNITRWFSPWRDSRH